LLCFDLSSFLVNRNMIPKGFLHHRQLCYLLVLVSGLAWLAMSLWSIYIERFTTSYILFHPDSRPVEMFTSGLTGEPFTPDMFYSEKTIMDRLEKIALSKDTSTFTSSSHATNEEKIQCCTGSTKTRTNQVIILTTETLREGNLRAVPLQNRQEYARLHNYGTLFNFINYVPENRCRAWNKVLLLYASIYNYQRDYQACKESMPSWIWMLDYDVFIMNHKSSLQEHIFDVVKERRHSRGESMESLDLILTQDCLGINTGSFLIRVDSPWVLDFLRLW
jgi:hypothetical protein